MLMERYLYVQVSIIVKIIHVHIIAFLCFNIVPFNWTKPSQASPFEFFELSSPAKFKFYKYYLNFTNQTHNTQYTNILWLIFLFSKSLLDFQICTKLFKCFISVKKQNAGGVWDILYDRHIQQVTIELIHIVL